VDASVRRGMALAAPGLMPIPKNSSQTLDLPVLPLRTLVLFPSAALPFTLTRASALRAVDAAGEGNLIAVVTQVNPQQDEPTIRDLYPVGVVAVLRRVARIVQDHEAVIAVLEGLERVSVVEELQQEPFLRVRLERLSSRASDTEDPVYLALRRNILEVFSEIVERSPSLPDDIIVMTRNIADASVLTDIIAAALPEVAVEIRQELLGMLDVMERMHRLNEILVSERESLRLREQIHSEVQEKIAGTQREYFLREQLKAIHKELGEEEDDEREFEELRERLEQAGLPEEASKESEREFRRLRRLSAASPEYTVIRTYLEWLADLPWNRTSGTEPADIDLERATSILDHDHYDLEKVKERILEYLAVQRIKKELKGPILCLVGPPGVGKTSVGKSIARATGREFVRLSLGGIHDEAEIRGHRRTYIGALPGQIIRSLRRAGTCDPVFMLDEVDKVGRDFRGDPAAALLEVLDPEQNHTFRDHYLDVPFDLSRVLFIATANIIDPIPAPLRDRMEVLELPGYIDQEKVEIAQRYLIPRQANIHGLFPGTHLRFLPEAISEIVHSYTHEAGVRKLEQHIAAICRKRARQVVENGKGLLVVTPQVVRTLLGAPRYRVETQLAERTRRPGVAVAVAWTPYGGDVLFIEATRMPHGKGDFTLTGQLGDVMQESARTALSWLRANGGRYGIDEDSFRKYDVHVHVPSGAVPKDGPSAGVVMVASLVSLFTDRPVRPHVAMTGEVTLSGVLLPVGGIKEKVLAARRSGVKEIIIPRENEPNLLEEVPEHLREGLAVTLASTIEDALAAVLQPASAGAQVASRRNRGQSYSPVIGSSP
jgi:ATP-dependent Lon protease